MYLYKATIYTSTDNVYGIDVTQNNADKTDFENNYKASTYAITDITVTENSLLTIKTYTQFKALITGGIIWADVKRMDEGNHYDLYLLSENPL